MSWIVNGGSGGSFVNTTGRLANPRTPAQMRLAAAASDVRSSLVYGIVQTEIPAATLLGPPTNTLTPSTTGTVRLNSDLGTAPIIADVPAVNPLLAAFPVGVSVVLDRRNDVYLVVCGLGSAATSLRPVALNASSSPTPTLVAGELLYVDATGGSAEIRLPSSENVVIGDEVGVYVYDISGSNTVTILESPGSGTVEQIVSKRGDEGTSIGLYGIGSYVRLKLIRVGVNGATWLLVDDERRDLHALAFTAEQSDAYTAVPGDLVRVNTSAASRTISLPADSPIDTEIGVVLTTAGATTKATITATGTGASIIGGKLPVISSVSVELFLAGDYVRLKHIGSNDWNVIAENTIAHSGSMLASTSAGQSINASSSTKIDFATSSYDVGGCNDLTNDRFTARRAGKYMVSCFLNFDTMTNGTLVQIVLRKNGADYVFQQDTSRTSSRLTADFVIDLAATDYAELFAFHNDSAGARAVSITAPPRMSVAEIR